MSDPGQKDIEMGFRIDIICHCLLRFRLYEFCPASGWFSPCVLC